jgi:CHAD domain-containing protein
VQRKIVSRIGRQWVKDPEDERRDEITEDIERLSKRVKRERKTHARGLRKVLSAIELPLQKRLEDCEDKLASLRPSNTTPYQHAEHWLAASKHHDRFRKPKDLHEFRKETKGVRYVAELQPELRSSIALARDLRSMNDAIGSWHDYEVLADAARSWIGKKSLLTKAIAQQRDRRWKIALRMVDSMKKKHAALFAS